MKIARQALVQNKSISFPNMCSFEKTHQPHVSARYQNNTYSQTKRRYASTRQLYHVTGGGRQPRSDCEPNNGKIIGNQIKDNVFLDILILVVQKRQ